MALVSCSLLSADILHLGRELQTIDKCSDINYIHIDVMDGVFVPNITIGEHVIRKVKTVTSKPLDVHLMIKDPCNWLRNQMSYGMILQSGDFLTFHIETVTHVHRFINEIRSINPEIGIGVALLPTTHESALEYCIKDIDLILVMTVDPGFGGQKIITSMYEKVSRIRSMVDKHQSNAVISVDGGINLESGRCAMSHGANMLVSGSFLFQDLYSNAALLRTDT